MVIGTYISKITLNVNGLNAPTKRHREADWIKKNKSLQYAALQETHFRAKDIHRLKVRKQKKIFHVNENNKKAEVAILISDKINFERP